MQANGYQTAMIGKIHLDGISTDRYKLIHFYYDVDEWELYDLKTDPMEMRNVYEHPEYAAVQEMMHTKLEEVRNYYGDSDAHAINNTHPRILGAIEEFNSATFWQR